MSNWRVNEEPPTNYLDILYDEEELEELAESEYEDNEETNVPVPPLEEFEDNEETNVPIPPPGAPPLEEFEDNEKRTPSPEAPLYSPLTSPLTRERSRSSRGRSRSRSRSPLWRSPEQAPLGVVVCIYDENGEPLPEEEGDFLEPDAHPLFFFNETNLNESGSLSDRGRSGRRGARRGVRGMRGRSGRGRGRGRRDTNARGQGNRWAVGDPLTEFFLTDDDVPPALINMVRDVLRNRRIREQGRIRENDDESESDEEFFDASDETFEWRCMDSFECKEEVFKEERTGSVQSHNSAYDAFRAYWDDEVLSRIVAETNSYASSIESRSFHEEWVPTNIHELLCLFAFWMMLGIIRIV